MIRSVTRKITRPVIGDILGSRVGAGWRTQILHNYLNRQFLLLPDSQSATPARIMPLSLRINGTNDYYRYVDSGGLDIAGNDFTVGCKFRVNNALATDQSIFGKCVLSGVLSGTYGFVYLNSTNTVNWFMQTSTGFVIYNTGIGAGVDLHLLAEIEASTNTLRIYNNGVQISDDIIYTGSFGETTKPIQLALGQRHNAVTLDRPADIDVGCAYIYKSILTTEQKAGIVNGVHVGGASLFWIFNNLLRAFDVSGNSLDVAITNRTGDNKFISYNSGYNYDLENGYSIYRWGGEAMPYQGALYVPHVNGVSRVNPLVPVNYTKYNDVEGSALAVNNICCGILFPSGVMDRSDAAIFNDTCRSSLYFDNTRPTLWDIREFQYDLFLSYINSNQNYYFPKFHTSGVVGRFLFEGMYVTKIPMDGNYLRDIEIEINNYNLRSKILIKNTRAEWECCSYYFNGKHYRVWSEGQADNWDKWIYTIDDNMVASPSYICATGCLATTDYHSMPSVCVDNDGYIYVIHEEMTGGVHGTDMLLFKSNQPEDITAGFTQVYELTGAFSYPQLVKLNGVIYCYFRNATTKDVDFYKINTSDELELIGVIFNGSLSALYKNPLNGTDETKLGLTFFESSNGEIDGVYYTQSDDGVNWYNAGGDVSVDISDSESINAVNKASFAVHEDSAEYNSVTSETGVFINGVPHIIIYEGIADMTGIEVLHIYIARFINGSWIKIEFPYTTPMAYADRAGFNHYLAYKNGIYYMFVISEYINDDLLNNSNIKLYKSSNLITWTEELFARPDYSYVIIPTAWFTPNAPTNNQIVWFWINTFGYAGTNTTMPFAQHVFYKL